MATGEGREEKLAGLLGDLAIELERQPDSESTLRAIVRSSVDLVSGARWAGISLVEGRRVTAQVPTDPLVEELDGLQTEVGEGPCLSALREHHTVLIDDMGTDERWPLFSRAARDHGVASSLSFQLFITERNIGALNLYGSESHVFTEDSRLVGEILAQHASVAMAGAARMTQFESALGTRDVIGQAKGLLMQRNRVTGLNAFQMLLRASQETNTKLVDLARWIVDTHEADANGADAPGLPTRRS